MYNFQLDVLKNGGRNQFEMDFRQLCFDMYPALRSLFEDNRFQQCVLNTNAVPPYFNEFVANDGLTNDKPQLTSIDVTGLPELPDLSETAEGHIISFLWDQYLDPTKEIIQVPPLIDDSSVVAPLLSTPMVDKYTKKAAV
jgi:hypothetical protein